MKTFRSSFMNITLLFILSGCFNSQTSESHIPPIINKQGQVNDQVTQILKLTDVNHNESLPDIVHKTQTAWLRKPGIERWEMEKLITEHDTELKKLFDEIGLYQEIKPTDQHYSYLLILGGLFSRMQKRFDYAIQLYQAGIRFNKIVLLAGARPAVSDQGENLTNFLAFSGQTVLDKVPQTETEMLKFIYDHSHMPEAMKKIPVQIIDVPMLATDSGTLRRPSTSDTITWWLNTNPTPGSCLAISNQPYVAYQQSVLQTILPADFNIQTVGPVCTQNEEISVLLDTLARILFQELQMIQKK